MNGAHVHLLVNHVPLFGVSFGLIALVWSIVRKSSDMRWAAVSLFVISGIFGWIAMETGEYAEEIAEKLPEVTKDLIHLHESAADYANIMTTATGVVALILVALLRFKPQFVKAAQYLLLLLSLLASISMARTAYLGGHVRHTEIRGESVNL